VRNRVLCLVIVSLVQSPAVSAQGGTLTLRPGMSVRVSAPRCGLHNYQTRLDSLRRDTLILADGRDLECVLSDVSRLEVSAGGKSHWLAGLGVGFLAGAGVGATVGGMSQECTHEWGSLCATVGAVTGASLGLLVGATVGAFIETDRWQQIPLAGVSLRISPTARGAVAVGVSIGRHGRFSSR